MYNSEHYHDPTAGEAIKNVEKERITKIIKSIKQYLSDNGYELANRIVLRDKETGKIHK